METMKTMKHIFRTVLFAVCLFACYSCDDDSKNESKIDIPEVDIADEIVGEWVYDIPEENAWQSMKFVAEGSYFCYSDKKEKWTEVLKSINKGNYGVKGNVISAANGATYLDMTVSKISGYEFTGRLNETTVDFKFNKVVMRTHLTYGQSITPPYEQLVDTAIVGYKSHDESLATVDNSTGEITAVANNGRTYVDVITKGGTAVVKVMIGKVNDGDEAEFSPIKKKDVTPPQPILNLPKAILGKWIWDVSYWESINFLENGKVYYSNVDAARGIYNENAPGEYTIDTSTNRLTLKVLPTGGTQMTVVMAMTAISKYSFTAKFYLTNGQSTGTFTYAKQLGTIELKGGETILPEYEKLVESGTVITKYQIHNNKIAEVNSETGEITAKKGGRTYVDIVTEDGTAVLEVNVEKEKVFWNMNYEDFLGTRWNDVANVFGTAFTRDDTKRYMYYDYSAGSLNDQQDNILDENWSMLAFYFEPDQNRGTVKAVALVQKVDAWFTAEEMNQYLKEKYHIYEKGTSETFKAFINDKDFEKATVGITWDMTDKVLMFQLITHETAQPTFDYGRYIGKTREEAKDLMKSEFGVSPSTDSDTNLGFRLDTDYVTYVSFKFDNAGTINYIQVRLKEGLDPNVVSEELGKAYSLIDNSGGNYFYQNSNGKLRVTYMPSSNVIQFKMN